MFNNLLDFRYIRSTKDAIGFYIFYLILSVILSMIIAGILAGILKPENSFGFGVKVGSIFAILMSVVLTTVILYTHKLHKEVVSIVWVVSALLLSLLGGGLLGLIPAAMLTTKSKNNIASDRTTNTI